MRAKVRVESNLRITNVFEPPLEMELRDDETTLRDVLRRLSAMCPYMKFIEKGEMGDDLRNLFLNGESHFSFPEGLGKKVHEGDTIRVEAYMEPLAGG